MNAGHRVLLVDDEPSFLVVMRRVIQSTRPDAVVVYAGDVAAAEWQLRTTDVCLVVTDMCMPSGESDGMRVVAAAREAGVPVAVLTGARGPWLDELARQDVPVLQKAELSGEAISALIARSLPPPPEAQ